MNHLGCVILAAGMNTRLDTGKPKSLLKINEQSLIERHISIFFENGITKFCIITGHQSNEIEREIERISPKYDVDIETVYNSQYTLENGISVWKAKEWVHKNIFNSFLLVMADHVFERDFVTMFLKAKKKFTEGKLFLAVDQPGTSNAHIDVSDVTKVNGDGGLILDIGKQIKRYNYYDTGLFEMSQEVFIEFEACFEQQKYSISNMVQSLTDKKQSQYIRITGHTWNDVDNLDDYNNSLDLNLS